jgi:hypothetical protein
MSALAIARPLMPMVSNRTAPMERPLPHLRVVGGERTLDDVIVGAWEALSAHRSVACPVCGGELAAEYGAHARPVGGKCRSCGTELS